MREPQMSFFITRVKSGLAVFLALALIAQSAPAAPAAPAPSFCSSFALPTHVGSITASFTPVNVPNAAAKGVPDVVLIQDLHVNRSVQLNISKILHSIKTAGWLPQDIAIEGAAGPVDVDFMQKTPDAEIRKQAADYLVSQGEMAGDMHFVVTEGAGQLYGIETPATYDSVIELYRKSYGQRIDLDRRLAELERALNYLSHNKNGTVRENTTQLRQDVQVLTQLVRQQVPVNELSNTLRQAMLAIDHLQMVLPTDQARALLPPLSAAINYYTLALMRNEDMFANLKTLRATTHQATSVLVVGGFHTPGLTDLLKKENLSFIVITPNVQKLDRVDEKLYVERMLGNHFTPEQMANGQDWAALLTRPPLAALSQLRSIWVGRVGGLIRSRSLGVFGGILFTVGSYMGIGALSTLSAQTQDPVSVETTKTVLEFVGIFGGLFTAFLAGRSLKQANTRSVKPAILIIAGFAVAGVSGVLRYGPEALPSILIFSGVAIYSLVQNYRSRGNGGPKARMLIPFLLLASFFGGDVPQGFSQEKPNDNVRDSRIAHVAGEDEVSAHVRNNALFGIGKGNWHNGFYQHLDPSLKELGDELKQGIADPEARALAVDTLLNFVVRPIDRGRGVMLPADFYDPSSGLTQNFSDSSYGTETKETITASVLAMIQSNEEILQVALDKGERRPSACAMSWAELRIILSVTDPTAFATYEPKAKKIENGFEALETKWAQENQPRSIGILILMLSALSSTIVNLFKWKNKDNAMRIMGSIAIVGLSLAIFNGSGILALIDGLVLYMIFRKDPLVRTVKTGFLIPFLLVVSLLGGVQPKAMAMGESAPVKVDMYIEPEAHLRQLIPVLEGQMRQRMEMARTGIQTAAFDDQIAKTKAEIAAYAHLPGARETVTTSQVAVYERAKNTRGALQGTLQELSAWLFNLYTYPALAMPTKASYGDFPIVDEAIQRDYWYSNFNETRSQVLRSALREGISNPGTLRATLAYLVRNSLAGEHPDYSGPISNFTVLMQITDPSALAMMATEVKAELGNVSKNFADFRENPTEYTFHPEYFQMLMTLLQKASPSDFAAYSQRSEIQAIRGYLKNEAERKNQEKNSEFNWIFRITSAIAILAGYIVRRTKDAEVSGALAVVSFFSGSIAVVMMGVIWGILPVTLLVSLGLLIYFVRHPRIPSRIKRLMPILLIAVLAPFSGLQPKAMAMGESAQVKVNMYIDATWHLERLLSSLESETKALVYAEKWGGTTPDINDRIVKLKTEIMSYKNLAGAREVVMTRQRNFYDRSRIAQGPLKKKLQDLSAWLFNVYAHPTWALTTKASYGDLSIVDEALSKDYWSRDNAETRSEILRTAIREGISSPARLHSALTYLIERSMSGEHSEYSEPISNFEVLMQITDPSALAIMAEEVKLELRNIFIQFKNFQENPTEFGFNPNYFQTMMELLQKANLSDYAAYNQRSEIQAIKRYLQDEKDREDQKRITGFKWLFKVTFLATALSGYFSRKIKNPDDRKLLRTLSVVFAPIAVVAAGLTWGIAPAAMIAVFGMTLIGYWLFPKNRTSKGLDIIPMLLLAAFLGGDVQRGLSQTEKSGENVHLYTDSLKPLQDGIENLSTNLAVLNSPTVKGEPTSDREKHESEVRKAQVLLVVLSHRSDALANLQKLRSDATFMNRYPEATPFVDQLLHNKTTGLKPEPGISEMRDAARALFEQSGGDSYSYASNRTSPEATRTLLADETPLSESNPKAVKALLDDAYPPLGDLTRFSPEGAMDWKYLTEEPLRPQAEIANRVREELVAIEVDSRKWITAEGIDPQTGTRWINLRSSLFRWEWLQEILRKNDPTYAAYQTTPDYRRLRSAIEKTKTRMRTAGVDVTPSTSIRAKELLDHIENAREKSYSNYIDWNAMDGVIALVRAGIADADIEAKAVAILVNHYSEYRPGMGSPGLQERLDAVLMGEFPHQQRSWEHSENVLKLRAVIKNFRAEAQDRAATDRLAGSIMLTLASLLFFGRALYRTYLSRRNPAKLATLTSGDLLPLPFIIGTGVAILGGAVVVLWGWIAGITFVAITSFLASYGKAILIWKRSMSHVNQLPNEKAHRDPLVKALNWMGLGFATIAGILYFGWVAVLPAVAILAIYLIRRRIMMSALGVPLLLLAAFFTQGSFHNGLSQTSSPVKMAAAELTVAERIRDDLAEIEVSYYPLKKAQAYRELLEIVQRGDQDIAAPLLDQVMDQLLAESVRPKWHNDMEGMQTETEIKHLLFSTIPTQQSSLLHERVVAGILRALTKAEDAFRQGLAVEKKGGFWNQAAASQGSDWMKWLNTLKTADRAEWGKYISTDGIKDLQLEYEASARRYTKQSITYLLGLPGSLLAIVLALLGISKIENSRKQKRTGVSASSEKGVGLMPLLGVFSAAGAAVLTAVTKVGREHLSSGFETVHQAALGVLSARQMDFSFLMAPSLPVMVAAGALMVLVVGVIMVRSKNNRLTRMQAAALLPQLMLAGLLSTAAHAVSGLAEIAIDKMISNQEVAERARQKSQAMLAKALQAAAA